MDQSGSPMLSPLRANEDGNDGSGQLQGINDDVEDDDPFLKRRYALVLIYIIHENNLCISL